jgi:hypothetical protein
MELENLRLKLEVYQVLIDALNCANGVSVAANDETFSFLISVVVHWMRCATLYYLIKSQQLQKSNVNPISHLRSSLVRKSSIHPDYFLTNKEGDSENSTHHRFQRLLQLAVPNLEGGSSLYNCTQPTFDQYHCRIIQIINNNLLNRTMH